MDLGWAAGAAVSLVALSATCVGYYVTLRHVSSRPARLALWATLCVLLLPMPMLVFSTRTHVVGVTALAGITGWWIPLRTLATLLHRGPVHDLLRNSDTQSERFWTVFPRFVACLILPVNVRFDAPKSELKSTRYFVAMGLLKTVLSGVIAGVILPGTSSVVVHTLSYAMIVYTIACTLYDLSSALAVAVFDLPCVRNFDCPWLATSLQEFWSRRWNTFVSANLRDGVFDPLMEQLYPEHNMTATASGKPTVRTPEMRRKYALVRSVAVLASFVASGVYHEWIIFNMTGESRKQWLSFFVLHGVLCLAEAAARRRLCSISALERIPAPLMIALRWTTTMALLTSTAWFLFFAPVLRGDVKDRVLANLLEWTKLLPR